MNDVTLMQRQELIRVCRKLRERGLVNATHGNVSVRKGDTMLITPTGCDLEEVEADELVAMDIPSAKVISAGKPSKEWELHLAVYRERPDAGGIVHAHSPRSVALGCKWGDVGKESIVPCYTLAFALFAKRLPMVGYYSAGSHELAAAAAAKLKEGCAVLLAHHGLITLAPSVKKAYYRLEEIEENCGIALSIGVSGNQELNPDRL